MNRGHFRLLMFVILLTLLGPTVACVERTVSISTEPAGATVILNDQELGTSPVKVPFTWYGDYEILVRKPGYKAVKTHHKLNAPWYQYPVIDLFAECLMPFTIHDDRTIPVVVMEPWQTPEKRDLLDSAKDMAEQAGS